MPQMGESIFEGTITKWLKKVGDPVEKDEPLFEISTDKVDAEIPSPVAGVLTEIKVPEGATVQINTVVAVIGGSVSVPSAAPRSRCPAAANRARQPHRRQRRPSAPRRGSASTAVDVRPANSAPRRWSARSPKTTTSTSADRRHRLRRPHHQGRHAPPPDRARPLAPSESSRACATAGRSCRTAGRPAAGRTGGWSR